jgi:hypothetical protein
MKPESPPSEFLRRQWSKEPQEIEIGADTFFRLVFLVGASAFYHLFCAAVVLKENQMDPRPFPKMHGHDCVAVRYFGGLAATVLLSWAGADEAASLFKQCRNVSKAAPLVLIAVSGYVLLVLGMVPRPLPSDNAMSSCYFFGLAATVIIASLASTRWNTLVATIRESSAVSNCGLWVRKWQVELAVLYMLVIIALMLSPPVVTHYLSEQALTLKLRPVTIDCDWGAYTTRYGDLATMTRGDAEAHYLRFGHAELRVCRSFTKEEIWQFYEKGEPYGTACDWGAYTTRYTDLATMTSKEAESHYLRFGHAESRVCRSFTKEEMWQFYEKGKPFGTKEELEKILGTKNQAKPCLHISCKPSLWTRCTLKEEDVNSGGKPNNSTIGVIIRTYAGKCFLARMI